MDEITATPTKQSHHHPQFTRELVSEGLIDQAEDHLETGAASHIPGGR
jgi:hypothetical protein